jgi:hypothetical protein
MERAGSLVLFLRTIDHCDFILDSSLCCLFRHKHVLLFISPRMQLCKYGRCLLTDLTTDHSARLVDVVASS